MSDRELVTIGQGQWDWLNEHVDEWIKDGILNQPEADRILSRYSPEPAGRTPLRLALVALYGLAIFMAGIGVLLVIGFNWAVIPRSGKVALILGGVAGAFLVSARLYATKRPLAGDLAAFAGTLLFGNAIWLLAQVFQIQSHYPDGALWWTIGALTVAWLLRSRVVGFEALVLVIVWLLMEGFFGGANYRFLLLSAVSFALAYTLRSGLLLLLALLAPPLWLLMSGLWAWDSGPSTAALLVLDGCAYYAIGRLHREGSPLGRTWRVIGFALLLVSIVPLTFTGFHRWAVSPGVRESIHALPIFGVVLSLLAVAVVGLFRGGTVQHDLPPVVAAVLTALWLVPVAIPRVQPLAAEPFGWTMAIVFSAITILLTVWLIVEGVRGDEAISFFSGVAFTMLFVIVRWFDLVSNMLWSALVLFLAAGALVAAARYWRHRHAHRWATGESSRG